MSREVAAAAADISFIVRACSALAFAVCSPCVRIELMVVVTWVLAVACSVIARLTEAISRESAVEALAI